MKKDKVTKKITIKKRKNYEILKKYKELILVGVLLLAHIFFRFYELQQRLQFGTDQADNAWAAKRLLIDHTVLLLGMVAKGNSGFFIGPFYYYFIAPFYALYAMNPIASQAIAGVTSILSFFVLYITIKKLFSYPVALVATFINCVSFFIISNDRVQWPVNFIVPVSMLVFFFLYKVITGKEKYLLYLALVLGFSLHIHFTSIFYFIIVLLALPFFPRNKSTIKYALLAIPLFLVWLVPQIIYEIESKHQESSNLSSYLHIYYHGFHFVRLLQLTHDAFIEFFLIFRYPSLQLLYYLPLPVFAFVYLYKKVKRERLLFVYLVCLWFFVPWFVFTTYSGEISNYYFFMTRPIVLIILAYLTVGAFSLKYIIAKVVVICFWLYFAYVNFTDFMQAKYFDYADITKTVKSLIKNNAVVRPYEKSRESYFYYYMTTYKNL